MEQAWKEPLAVLAKALLSSPHKAGLGMKILFQASTTYLSSNQLFPLNMFLSSLSRAKNRRRKGVEGDLEQINVLAVKCRSGRSLPVNHDCAVVTASSNPPIKVSRSQPAHHSDVRNNALDSSYNYVLDRRRVGV